jgi:hypothetical protein
VKYLWILLDSTFLLKVLCNFKLLRAWKGGLLFGLCLLIRILGFNCYKIDSVKWNLNGGFWLVGVPYIDIFVVIFLGRWKTKFAQMRGKYGESVYQTFDAAGDLPHKG